MRGARIPITFQHVVTGDQAHTTIPASYASKSPVAILGLCRKASHTWRIVGRGETRTPLPSCEGVSAKIGLVCGTAWPDIIGGGELVWKSIGQHLQTMGYDVHVFAWARATYGAGKLRAVGEIERRTVAGMEYHTVPSAKLLGYVQNWAMDVRPSSLWMSYGWDLGINMRLASLSGLAPLVCYQQFWMGLDVDAFSVPEEPHVKPDWAPLFDAPDVLVGNSDFTSRRLASATTRPVEVITPPTDDALGTSTRDGAILMVGAGYEKGTDIVLRIADQMPGEEFVIIGDEPATHAPNCKSIGWSDPRPFYRSAKALLAPSLVVETYGMAVEEARKWGIPTVVSSNGALAEHAEVGVSTARVQDWVDATEKAVSGAVGVTAPVARHRDAIRQLEGVMRRLPGTATADGFPSVATHTTAAMTSLGYCNTTLVDDFGLTPWAGSGDAIPPGVKAVLLHGWEPEYGELFALARDGGVRPLCVLHSPAAQGELDGESRIFETVLPLGTAHYVCTHAPLAKALGARWLPVPVSLEPLAQARRGPKDIGSVLDVGLWNPRGGRKNVWTQILACRELARISGREVALHSPIEASAVHYALGEGVSIRPTPFLDRPEYLARVASMDLTLQVSHAESFNYCAIESALVGVPCLVGPGTPAGRFGMEGAFVVDDPTDPILIAQRAWKTLQDASEDWFHSLMIQSALELVDYRHRALRDTLQAIERDEP